ncbi:major facilitator superfamily transporter [Lasiosphaeria hispida]|uniref:Major facilitator superfamily transporter n=1 Tax=Lasiosphaeria hispida TaxID=260671 RepID=A0AAJ0MCV3_9PEZI|nr:major facilitator superfamily transporter [Lasiosphaeria hispida]
MSRERREERVELSSPNDHQSGPLEIDADTEKRIRRKLDRRVITLVFLLYLVAFLDRSNIGNAEAAGMSKDLGFDDAHFQWLLTIFYIPYILFEWCAIMWKIVPPHIWAGVTVMTWGLASTLQAAAFNWQGLMACRWFLAMAEAGFAPGVPYLLSFFYRRNEIGVRCGIFLSAAPLATTFAGALAFGITSSHLETIASWRLLFLVEGLPTMLLAVVVFLYLPDSPDTASFLTAEEKEVARARSVLQSGKEGADRIGGFDWAEALAACASPQTWIQPLMYFSCNVSFSSLPVFLPAILSAMGYSSVNSQGLTAPPYFLAFLVCIATTYLADRTRQRGAIITALSVVAGVGYLILATVHSVGARYFGVFLAAAGVFPAIANILSWVLNNQGTDTKRGVGIALLNIIGQCGPLLGTRLFPVGEAPYYTKGMAVCAAFMFFNGFLAVVLRFYFVRENNKLERGEREAAAAVEAAGGGKAVAVLEMSEMEGGVGYRYVL